MTRSQLVTLGIVIAGLAACSKATIMGIPPYLITHMVLAANENIGALE